MIALIMMIKMTLTIILMTMIKHSLSSELNAYLFTPLGVSNADRVLYETKVAKSGLEPAKYVDGNILK